MSAPVTVVGTSIVCPECGATQRDAWEIDHPGIWFCGSCEREYEVVEIEDVRWYTVGKASSPAAPAPERKP